MRRWAVVLLLAGCSGESGGGEACEPVEGGAPCCDAPDPETFICPDGYALHTNRAPEDAGGYVTDVGCRPVGMGGEAQPTGAPKGPIISYRADGSVAAYGDGDASLTRCGGGGRVESVVRAVGGMSLFESGGCVAECYGPDGQPLGPGACPAEGRLTPFCE